VKDGAAMVCVVDDDVSVRRGLERLLRSAGYRVTTFGSAREFLDRLDIANPRCLVLDIRMPGQNGLDLQEALVAAGHEVPVVFITGNGDIPMAVRAMKAGAVDFLAKPLDDKELLEGVREAITAAVAHAGRPPLVARSPRGAGEASAGPEPYGAGKGGGIDPGGTRIRMLTRRRASRSHSACPRSAASRMRRARTASRAASSC
jgi:DNA-binding NtrC family response regulator